MKPCHTIDGKSCAYGQVCHLHLTIVYDGHFSDLILISGILILNGKYKSLINLFHDLIASRQKSGE